MEKVQMCFSDVSLSAPLPLNFMLLVIFCVLRETSLDLLGSSV
jgi:hypothetical protein